MRERNYHPLPHTIAVFPALISSRRLHDLNTWNMIVVERAHFPYSTRGFSARSEARSPLKDCQPLGLD